MHPPRKSRRARMLAVLAVTITATTTATNPAAAASPTGAPNRPTSVAENRVTLLTGDTVLLDPAGQPSEIRAGEGRVGTAFRTYQREGHRYVVPGDALSAVANGILDERLFDITTLVASGYTDAQRANIPLIVTYPSGARSRMTAPAGATATRALPSIDGAALSADKTGSAWPTLLRSGVRRIWLDARMKVSLDRSTVQIGAPEAWQAGYTGAGVKVAVLDSGVDETHPDLAGREVAQRNFSSSPNNVDHVGHGTHVASTIAGTGAKSDGRYRGVADGAQILDAKVFDDNGYGSESAFIAGAQWAADNGARIINYSGGGTDDAGVSPAEQFVNDLSARTGVLFVIAAGNYGPAAETVDTPGSADAALTVGAVDRDDNLADFSGRGPRVGDSAIKPEITAPGVGIVAARAAQGQLGEPVTDGYVAMDGTSMATPHVAGAAAIIAQQHPDWTGEQIKETLVAAAEPNPRLTADQQGAGRVDIARAIHQQLTAAPAVVNLGRQSWPHTDDTPLTSTITYHNSGSGDLTLTLTAEAAGPGNQPAPAGLFTVSPTRVTVPAGGDAKATLTAAPSTTAPEGRYTGVVAATDGSGTGGLRTLLSFDQEPESYQLTIEHIGRDGKPTPDYRTIVGGMDSRRVQTPHDDDGTISIRVPKGRYLIDSQSTGDRLDWLLYPALTITRDTTITLDFRRAEPMRITAPDPTAKMRFAQVSYLLDTSRTYIGTGWIFDDPAGFAGLATAHLGPEVGAPETLISQVDTQWLAANGDYYGLAWYPEHTWPTGFTRIVSKSELAHVHARFGSALPSRTGLRSLSGTPTRATQDMGVFAVLLPVSLPGERDEYLTTENVTWHGGLRQADGDGNLETSLATPNELYRAGRTYQQRIGYGVFGPALPATTDDRDWVSRTGDVLRFNTPLFGDAAGNSGDSLVTSANTTIYRDGRKLDETAYPGAGLFTLPAAPANYRVTTTGTRDVADVSTTVSAAWTFRSTHVDDAEPVRLPISTIRFTPQLDADNTAPAGRAFTVPVTVVRQAGADAVTPSSLTVEVSYDHGRTWHRATVVGGQRALLKHPRGTGTVSLRAKATERGGNTVEVTIIDAYRLR
ncbi:S8 family peptidase [Micromonospora luteifusca]|uniref:S8 family peptidase n=1 Tax=Micromonospora luteifusca TaxID=709860 RepID=UPI0033B62DEA